MFKNSRVLGLLMVLWIVFASPAYGQATVGINTGVYSHYVWRGITFTSDAVVQQDVSASYAGFTGGVWSNVEVVSADASELSLRGADNRGFGEIDYWLEYGRSLKGADVTFGGVYYTFQGYPGSGDGNTAEVYGTVSWPAFPMQPSLAVYYDFNNVKGAYVEGSAGYSLPVSDGFSVDLGALAGFSAGQEVDVNDPAQAANFASGGFTHADFSASSEFVVGAVSIAPVVHVQIALDGNTRITGTGVAQQDARSKIWFGMSIGWSR